VTNTLVFAPPERLKFIPIPILNDSLKEAANETFRVTLSNPVGVSLGSTKTTTVAILDNDQGFAFESTTYWVAEDAGVALISVRRGTDDTNSTVTVMWPPRLQRGQRTGLRRPDQHGHVCAGDRVKVFPIPILKRRGQENTESFRLTLRNPTGGAVLARRSPPPSISRIMIPEWGLNSPAIRMRGARGRLRSDGAARQ